LGDTSNALGFLISDVVVSKASQVCFFFFFIDDKLLYSFILDRDWIHTSECVVYTLHQRLMFLVGNRVENVEADKNHLSNEFKMFKAQFHSLHVPSIIVLENMKREH